MLVFRKPCKEKNLIYFHFDLIINIHSEGKVRMVSVF